MMMLVLLQRRLQTCPSQAPAAPTGWSRLNLFRPLALMFSDADQGKTNGDIILEKDHVESVVQTGGSAAASPEKSPAAEPSVDVDAVQAQPNVFLVSDSPVAPAAAGVLPDDAATSTGDDDEDTESDSYGEEVDHSSAATGLGKDP